MSTDLLRLARFWLRTSGLNCKIPHSEHFCWSSRSCPSKKIAVCNYHRHTKLPFFSPDTVPLYQPVLLVCQKPENKRQTMVMTRCAAIVDPHYEIIGCRKNSKALTSVTLAFNSAFPAYSFDRLW